MPIMDSGIEPGDRAPKMRQRLCRRAACATQVSSGSGSRKNCCDESCLVKIASRECDIESSQGSHEAAKSLKQPSSRGIGCPNDDGIPNINSNNRPCADHYQKTKDRYGVLLDNLGCICNILLSLNLESCCVIPSHSSRRSKTPPDSASDKVASTLCKPTTAVDMQQADDYCQGSGCNDNDLSEVFSNGVSDYVPPNLHKYTGNGRSTGNSFTNIYHTIGGNTLAKPDGVRNNSCILPSENIENLSPASHKGYDNARYSRTSSENPIGATDEQMLSGNDCCSGNNCTSRSSEVAKEGGTKRTSSGGDEYERGCCGGDSSGTVAKSCERASPKVDDDCSAQGCCGSNVEISSVGHENCARKATCENHAAEPVSDEPDVDDCCGKACCAKPSKFRPASEGPAIARLPKNSCGDSKNTCCPSEAETPSESVSVGSVQKIDSAPRAGSRNGIDNIDIERGLFGMEHVVLHVQGMTCTGCENKLSRSLKSLPAISNIKTSLLLSQAEFDLRGSASINGKTIAGTIEKMTGFSCAKVIESGERLDLIVDGNIEKFTQSWPHGVSDVTVTGERTIRVFYQPHVIGARDLLANPFFHSVTLDAPAQSPLVASGKSHVLNTLWRTIVAALLTIPVLVLSWAPLPRHELIYGSIQLSFATIIQVAIAGPFYVSAFKTLVMSRMIEMDLLIVLSTTTAYIYSVVAYGFVVARRPLSTGEFFETSTLLVTLIMVGRTVSAYARQRAVESISIESLQVDTATVVTPKNEDGKEIDARLLHYDDTFKVFPEMSIVTDGMVVSGESEVDESMITGESILITKGPGMSVIAGSVNHSGTLLVKVTRLPSENTIKTIGAMVDEAKSSKPKIQEIADRVASYFVPVILGVTMVVFLIWVAVGKAIRDQSDTVACINAMTYAISVLIVSCPCAIGLAVPMVVVIAGGVAAQHGLIFKTAETVDTARKITHVIFDKTGTLTQGKLSVVSRWYLESAPESLPNIIFGLTSSSKHPVSTAIASYIRDADVLQVHIDNVVSIAGKGIEATWNGLRIRAGNPHWLEVQNSPNVRDALLRGLSIFCVSVDGELVAVFGLQDIVRLDALETIYELKKRSVEISVISGDNEEAVKSIATQLGVPAGRVRSGCTPAEKQAYVKESLLPKNSVVLFCGDGTNDAVALAQATIGMHMNEGTDVAQSAADAVLMRPSLRGVITLMDLSQAFHRRVVFNFAWSFIYNLFAILLAAGAFPYARIPPQFAGLGEIVSVLPVIAIAMHLKWTKL